MLINFVFPAHVVPERGQSVDIRAHTDNFDSCSRKFTRVHSLPCGMCGEVMDIQPHADPDFRVVTVSITSEL